MKRITQLENDMNNVSDQLSVNNEKLEKANKKTADVNNLWIMTSYFGIYFVYNVFLFHVCY